MKQDYRVMVGSGKREAFRFRADLSQASAPIVLLHEMGDTPTPFQTADAQHRQSNVARLLADWLNEPLGAGWYVGNAKS